MPITLIPVFFNFLYLKVGFLPQILWFHCMVWCTSHTWYTSIKFKKIYLGGKNIKSKNIFETLSLSHLRMWSGLADWVRVFGRGWREPTIGVGWLSSCLGTWLTWAHDGGRLTEFMSGDVAYLSPQNSHGFQVLLLPGDGLLHLVHLQLLGSQGFLRQLQFSAQFLQYHLIHLFWLKERFILETVVK